MGYRIGFEDLGYYDIVLKKKDNLEETEAIIFNNANEGRLENEALQESKTAGFERYLK